jgi:hypothetical protein
MDVYNLFADEQLSKIYYTFPDNLIISLYFIFVVNKP